MQTNLILMTALTCGLVTSALAGSQSFDFKDPKGVNNALFKLDAPLEAINGTANGISGTVNYDPEKPEEFTGKIVVEAKSLTVPNPMMNEHLHGNQWLDVEKFPAITFEATKVSKVKREGDNVSAEVTGKFTLRDVTKEITVPVKLSYLKDKLAARTMGQMHGDLLVLRAAFTIKRSDYGVNPKAPADKVAEEIELTLSLAGGSPKK
jgi:polyisoprenoid-binding protein YceI